MLHYSGMNEAVAAAPPAALTIEVLRTLSALETRLEDALEPLGLSLAKLGVLAQLVGPAEPCP